MAQLIPTALFTLWIAGTVYTLQTTGLFYPIFMVHFFLLHLLLWGKNAHAEKELRNALQWRMVAERSTVRTAQRLSLHERELLNQDEHIRNILNWNTVAERKIKEVIQLRTVAERSPLRAAKNLIRLEKEIQEQKEGVQEQEVYIRKAVRKVEDLQRYYKTILESAAHEYHAQTQLSDTMGEMCRDHLLPDEKVTFSSNLAYATKVIGFWSPFALMINMLDAVLARGHANGNPGWEATAQRRPAETESGGEIDAEVGEGVGEETAEETHREPEGAEETSFELRHGDAVPTEMGGAD